MLSAILALAPLFDDPQIREATASASQEGNPLQHLWDGDLDTRWAAEGRPWIEISFDRLLEISAFEIAPYLSEEREYRFVLQVPAGEGWRPAGTLHSVRAAHGLQLVTLPEPISTARLRIACQGNNANDWNTYYELRFPGVQPPAPPPAPTVPRPSNLPTRMGLVAEVFAENPMLASPVAVHVDPSGAVFVTETQRRKKQNLDIRNNADWIDVELALGSVAEKEAFLRANLTPERSEENRRRVDDYNKDGSHDWRDLMAVPDRVHRLVDVDGDGGADEATVYADDLAGVVSGVAAGVFAHRGEVFVTQCPDVYRYRDTDGDGRADERDAIASGFGVHIAYGGHNMHGLIVGPDGRLYWSIGDIASDHHPWEGAVFRCWPDGSEFEVFARGLRNPQELAFDEYGDLFTGDNDGDFGDRERWVHVLAGADYGWRMNFQLQTQSWGAPTGNYSVWIEDGLWRPPFEGRAAYAQPPVANIQDGPCGLTYYPGIGLDESFDGTFFLAHFRGGTNSSVRRLRNEPAGATHRLVEDEEVVGGIAVTGLDFGSDGALYLCDWINGWDVKPEGKLHRVFDPTRAQHPGRIATQLLLAQDWSAVPLEVLGDLLGAPSFDVRLEAQHELVARGPETARLLGYGLKDPDERVARHALWALAQLAREDDSLCDLVGSAMHDPREEMRAQAARAVGELAFAPAAPTLVDLASAEEHPRPLYQQLIALSRLGVPEAVPIALDILSDEASDPALRHGCMLVLHACADRRHLAQLRTHQSRAVRLAAVVALRRHADRWVGLFLDDPDPDVVLEAARAIHDEPIAEATGLLARLADRPLERDALTRRVLAANLTLGDFAAAERVAALAARPELSTAMRAEALAILADWERPNARDRVTGAWRPKEFTPRDGLLVRDALRARLAALLGGPPEVQAPAAVMAQKFGMRVDLAALQRWVIDPDLPAPTRIAALDLLVDRDALDDALLARVLISDSVAVVAHAWRLAARQSPQQAIELCVRALRREDGLWAQRAIDVLAEIPGARAEVERLLVAFLAGDVPARMALEVREAARAHGLDPGVDAEYLDCLEGGDPTGGRAVFLDSARTQCMRCHKAGDLDGRSGADVGPELSGLGEEKGREYLLRAILHPNADIAEGFDRDLFLLTDGTHVVGRVLQESAASLLLEGKYLDEPAEAPAYPIELALDEIDGRKKAESPMPLGLADTMTRRELRDLIAFLESLED